MDAIEPNSALLSLSSIAASRADTVKPTDYNLHDGIDSTLLILRHRLKANEHHAISRQIITKDTVDSLLLTPSWSKVLSL